MNNQYNWEEIKRFYADYKNALDRTPHNRWAFIYQIGIHDEMTPIEKAAWQALRVENVVMYPQYPIANMFLDFANHKLKIAIEMDGRDYHEIGRDKQRDAKLKKLGWTVYRVPGSECCTRVSRKWENDPKLFDYPEMHYHEQMCDFYHNSIDGVVRALAYTYFNAGEAGALERRYIRETLDLHESKIPREMYVL